MRRRKARGDIHDPLAGQSVQRSQHVGRELALAPQDVFPLASAGQERANHRGQVRGIVQQGDLGDLAPPLQPSRQLHSAEDHRETHQHGLMNDRRRLAQHHVTELQELHNAHVR